MPEPLSPIEEDLWNLALACTNDASGASRIVASLVRDHRDIGRVSEARLRRDVLARADLWGARAESSVQSPVYPPFEPLNPIERAALWLDAGPGLTVAGVAWVCERDTSTIRHTLQDLHSRFDGDEQSIATELRNCFDATDRTELFERLTAARQTARRKDRRRAALLLGVIGAFVLLMAFVLFDLLNWRDASETLPSRVDPTRTVDPLP